MLNYPKEVINLFKSDNCHKNFRAHFVGGKRPDITNENVVPESVKFAESLCSRDNIKFGLCEAATLEFDTVNVGNIQGEFIQAFYEYETKNDVVVEEVGTPEQTASSFKAKWGIKSAILPFCSHIEDITVEGIGSWSGSYVAYDVAYYDDNGALILKNNERCRDIVRTEDKLKVNLSFDDVVYLSISVPETDEDLTAKAIEKLSFYREDIDKTVIPVPIGIFYVDECERQSVFAVRSNKCYSMEYLQDFSLPRSLEEFKKSTWNGSGTLSFTVEQIIDLIYPSYSYQRHIDDIYQHTGDIVDTVADTSFDLGKENDDAFSTKFYIEVENHLMPEPEVTSSLIATYKVVGDALGYEKAINQCKEYIAERGFITNIEWQISQSLGGNHIPGRAERIENHSAYLPTDTATIAQVHEPETSEVVFNLPYTDFIEYKYGGSIDGYRKYHRNGVTIGVYKDSTGSRRKLEIPGGITVAYPTKVTLYRKDYGTGSSYQVNKVLEFDLPNQLMYYTEPVAATGKVLNLASKRRQVRDLWQIDMNAHTVKKLRSTRTDYGYTEALNELESKGLRNIVESYFELRGSFGHFNRFGAFEEKKIQNREQLYPSNGMLPSQNLLPNDKIVLLRQSDVSQVEWRDDEEIIPYVTISAVYNDSDLRDKAQMLLRFEKEPDEYMWTLIDGNKVTTNSPVLNISTDRLAEDDKALWVSASILFNALEVNMGTQGTYTIQLDHPANDYILTGDISKIKQIRFIFDSYEYYYFWASIKVVTLLEQYYDSKEGKIYDMSGNFYFSDDKLSYTAEKVEEMLTDVANKIKGITYIPSSIEFHGRPDVEAGDHIGFVSTKDGGFYTIALKHELSGIQHIVSSIESK